MGTTPLFLLPQLPKQFHLHTEMSVSQYKSAERSIPRRARGVRGPRHIAALSPRHAGQGSCPAPGRVLSPGLGPEFALRPSASRSLQIPGISHAGTCGPADPLPSPLPAASPIRTRRCLSRVSGSLRVSSTFCVDFRTSPCGFLENIPPGPAPAPSSRGGQRPPDLPALGPLHSQRRQHRLRLLLLTPTEMRRGRRGAARSQLPAGRGAGLGLDSPFFLPRLPPAASRQPSGTTPGVPMATASRRHGGAAPRSSEARRAGPRPRSPGAPAEDGEQAPERDVPGLAAGACAPLGNSNSCRKLYFCSL